MRCWAASILAIISIVGSTASLWAIRGDLKMIPPNVIWGVISLCLFIGMGLITWWLYNFDRRMARLEGKAGSRPPTAGGDVEALYRIWDNAEDGDMRVSVCHDEALLEAVQRRIDEWDRDHDALPITLDVSEEEYMAFLRRLEREPIIVGPHGGLLYGGVELIRGGERKGVADEN